MIFWLLSSLIFIGLQGLFSGLETGMVSIPRPRAEHAAKTSGTRASAQILFFLNHPGIMISTTLIGVNISVVLASLSVKNFTECCGLTGGAGIALSTSILSLIFLVAEIIPKDWFRQAPYQRCVRTVFLLRASYVLLWPVIRLFTALTDALNRQSTAGRKETPDQTMREDLRLFIRESEGYGSLDPGTAGILQHVLTLPNMKLRDLANPWENTPCISASATIREAFRNAAENKTGKLPVCEHGNTGKCLGVFYVYDAISKIPEALWNTENVSVCMEKIHVLRETDGIPRAIELSRKERITFFLLVDSSGTRTGTLDPEKIAELLFE